MDLNLIVLSGRLAAPIEVRAFESGSQLVRLLLTVRTTSPRPRVDVIPVTLWEPTDELIDELPEPGRRIWVAGTIQRRFWSGGSGRRSRLEVIADQVTAHSTLLDLEAPDQNSGQEEARAAHTT